MSRPRGFVVGVAAIACMVAAVAANAARAASDPLGFGLRDDDGGRSSPLLRGPDPAAPRAAAEPALRGNPLWGISLSSLRATRERPLFSPSRRPPAAAVIAPPVEPVKVAAPPPEPEKPPLDLVGVVTGTAGADEGYAVFVSTATHDVVRLRTGEGHDGWILQSVSGREVVLEKDHRTAVVALPQPSAVKK